MNDKPFFGLPGKLSADKLLYEQNEALYKKGYTGEKLRI